MHLRKAILFGAAFALLAAGLLVVFTGVARAADGEDDLSKYLSVPNDEGVEPCAVFEAHWGYQWLRAGDYPACVEHWPEVHVACYTAEGTWTRETVRDFLFDPKPGDPYGMQFTYTITQDGVCGVFPNEPPFSTEFALLFFGLLTESIYWEPPATVSTADLPIIVYHVEDPETAPIGTGELPIFVIATSQPNSIKWEMLDEGLYVMVHPSEIEYSDLPESLFGGQTTFDVYPEGIYTLPDDPTLVEYFPLP